ncbi:hypothetical protein RRF57_001413 [Xylaria bambusicola]|uniref:Uncharacterized protein n=1 Tax=Xylaria bambusicola TaxID=326684 RepID=A0AAN7Z0Q6_9PEZI
MLMQALFPPNRHCFIPRRTNVAIVAVNENLKLDLRNINIEEEMKTLWSIPQAMMEHKHLKEVIESWKKSNDTMLVALVDGRPIYRKEDIEGM